MRGRLLKKGHGVICSEDETDSPLTPEKETQAFDFLLSSMSESTLSRLTLRGCLCILHQQRCKDGTSIKERFNSFRLLFAQYRAVGGTMSDVSVGLAMLRTLNDSAIYQGIITTIRVSNKLEELALDEIEFKMVVGACDIDLESKLGSGFGASGHPPCPHFGKTNYPPERY
jgi:hypothetical protein